MDDDELEEKATILDVIWSFDQMLEVKSDIGDQKEAVKSSRAALALIVKDLAVSVNLGRHPKRWLARTCLTEVLLLYAPCSR